MQVFIAEEEVTTQDDEGAVGDSMFEADEYSNILSQK